ncbi:MAG: hypothetical protein R3C05_19775 [Pirellulaceae bacterium]
MLAITLGTLLCSPHIRNSRAFLFAVAIVMGTPALVLAQMVFNTLAPVAGCRGSAIAWGWSNRRATFPY